MTKQERLERDIAKLAEMKAHEDELRAAGYRYIAGIDEVGRGPPALTIQKSFQQKNVRSFQK